MDMGDDKNVKVSKCSNGVWDHLLVKRWPHYLTFPVMLYFIGYQKSAIIVTIAFFVFFRSPNRYPLKYDKNVLYSPADGVVMEVKRMQDRYIICIFLSVTNVHVQYSPTRCKVIAKRYKRGEFNVAYIMEKSDLNERLETDLQTDTGDNISVVQIAGQVAQRIESFVKTNDILDVGCRLGVIKFGSRVDLHVPLSYKILTKKGEVVVGGISQLCKTTDK